MSLEIAREFVMKFGNSLEGNGEALLRTFLALLSQHRPVIRKKAIACIGHHTSAFGMNVWLPPGVLSLWLTDHQLHDLFSVLLENVNSPDTRRQKVIASIQALGIASYAVGSRAGKHVDPAMASIMALIQAATDEDVELLESCIRAVESYITRCPLFVQPYLEAVIDTCVKFLHFDPNYADDMSVSDDPDMQTEEEEEDMYNLHWSVLWTRWSCFQI